jgi:DNA-binding GntR family transcriptional regulator
MATRRAVQPAGQGGAAELRVLAGERPRRSVLSDTTYEAIKLLIMDNRLAPGARISMEGLARELEVSPTPVREALARLDAEGLVVKRPLAGYTVSPQLDLAAFEDLFRMRMLLEPEAARLAAGRPVDLAELTDLNDLNERMANVPAGEGYAAYRDQVALDARFHDAIAAASGSPLLREAISRLRAHMHLYRLYWGSGIATTTAAEHDRIVAALSARDPDAAAEAMYTHLRASHDRLIQFTGQL